MTPRGSSVRKALQALEDHVALQRGGPVVHRTTPPTEEERAASYALLASYADADEEGPRGDAARARLAELLRASDAARRRTGDA